MASNPGEARSTSAYTSALAAPVDRIIPYQIGRCCRQIPSVIIRRGKNIIERSSFYHQKVVDTTRRLTDDKHAKYRSLYHDYICRCVSYHGTLKTQT